MCQEYERANWTLEGRKEYYNDQRLANDELAAIDYSTKAECNRIMRIENPNASKEELDAMKQDLPKSAPKVADKKV